MSDVVQVSGDDDDIEIDENDDRTFRNKLPNCLNKLIKIIFSTPGLVILVILYSIMGAFIFPILEAPTRNIKNNLALAKSREDCLRELWTITEKLNVLYEKHWKELIDEQLRRFEGTIVAATRNGATTGIEYNKTTKWSFSEALLYSVTVITTIGHGSLTPKTSGGKIVTIFYALIGVPLMLMCLSSLGGLLAEALQCTYTKFCCARNRRNHKNCAATAGKSTNGSRSGTSCMGKSSYEMDCTLCKYDAVSSETKLHNSYEYTAVNERDDSCHLLHNSPLKVNHSSPLMQIKSAAMHHSSSSPIKQQYCAIQGQQTIDGSPLKQQQQQQHNNHQLSKHNHLHHHHQQQQQHQLQHGSPQHYQMTLPKNYRIAVAAAAAATTASSSVNGSTATLTETIGSSTATLGSTISIGGNVGGQPSSICIPQGTTTTTVYFPIAATNPLNNQYTCNTIHFNQQQQPQQQQQQLVKYHTIQLQQHAGGGGVGVNSNANNNSGGNMKNLDQSIVGQTSATVHAGIRRGKYLPKPMPHEINMLLAESDISSSSSSSLGNHHQHHHQQQQQHRNDTNGSSISPNSSTCNLGVPPMTEQTKSPLSAGIVDIMEDEEENEHERSISMSCPHGTPSRIPLLQSSSVPGSPSYHRNNGMDIELEDKSSQHFASTLNTHSTAVGNKYSNNKSNQHHHQHDKSQENGGIINSSGTAVVTFQKQPHHQKHCRSGGDDCTTDDDCEDDCNVQQHRYECSHRHHHHHHQHEQQQVPITIVLFILTSYIFLGTVIFAFWENWSFIDGAYFCFVTLSTIGYGDFLPLHTFHHGPDVQLFACCIYLLMGLVLVAMSFSILETQLMWKCKRIAVRLKLAKD